MNESESKIAIVMGSKSDEAVMTACEDALKYFEIKYEKFILSAHRSPDETADFAKNAHKNGFKVIIAAAGMAAHLPGVIASHTSLPVIGVPLAASELGGIDALYSIVQMPKGIPVATMAIGKAGAANAAIYAVKILALFLPQITTKLDQFKSQGYRF